ncbi:hypothetical protein EDC01DRAFT_635296 [Geopyxis carbonaria]|nr:hypothetical protein EDC01DRAFT_635296 [Geopyxis carbonaria]
MSQVPNNPNGNGFRRSQRDAAFSGQLEDDQHMADVDYSGLRAVAEWNREQRGLLARISFSQAVSGIYSPQCAPEERYVDQQRDGHIQENLHVLDVDTPVLAQTDSPTYEPDDPFEDYEQWGVQTQDSVHVSRVHDPALTARDSLVNEQYDVVHYQPEDDSAHQENSWQVQQATTEQWEGPWIDQQETTLQDQSTGSAHSFATDQLETSSHEEALSHEYQQGAELDHGNEVEYGMTSQQYVMASQQGVGPSSLDAQTVNHEESQWNEYQQGAEFEVLGNEAGHGTASQRDAGHMNATNNSYNGGDGDIGLPPPPAVTFSQPAREDPSNLENMVAQIPGSTRWTCTVCGYGSWRSKNEAKRHAASKHLQRIQCPLVELGRCPPGHAGWTRSDHLQMHWERKHANVSREWCRNALLALNRGNNGANATLPWVDGISKKASQSQNGEPDREPEARPNLGQQANDRLQHGIQTNQAMDYAPDHRYLQDDSSHIGSQGITDAELRNDNNGYTEPVNASNNASNTEDVQQDQRDEQFSVAAYWEKDHIEGKPFADATSLHFAGRRRFLRAPERDSIKVESLRMRILDLHFGISNLNHYNYTYSQELYNTIHQGPIEEKQNED